MPARGKDFGGGATLDSPRAAGDKKVMQVYVSKGGQQYGPYTVEQLRQYVEVGNFAPTDHACCDGANWVTIAQVPGFAPAVGKTVPKQVERPAEKPRGKLYLIIGIAVLLIVASSVGLYFAPAEQFLR